jgi:hypothetical protein
MQDSVELIQWRRVISQANKIFDSMLYANQSNSSSNTASNKSSTRPDSDCLYFASAMFSNNAAEAIKISFT